MTTSQVQTRRTREKVQSLDGQEIQLLHVNEKKLYEGAQQRYLKDYTFTAANDLREIDRLVLLEVQMYRAQWYLAAGEDYDAVTLEAKEEVELRRSMKDLSAQIVELQRNLGLTKAQRDKQDVDSVGGYITQLKQAAKAHGVRREKQLGKSIELLKQLLALTGAYSRSDENERRKIGVENADQIIEWIEEYLRPEFDAVDEYFRHNEQRFWVRNL